MQSGWIAVSDRLPPEDEVVLVNYYFNDDGKDGISKPDDWFVLSQKPSNESDLNDIIAQGKTQENDFRQPETNQQL